MKRQYTHPNKQVECLAPLLGITLRHVIDYSMGYTSIIISIPGGMRCTIDMMRFALIRNVRLGGMKLTLVSPSTSWEYHWILIEMLKEFADTLAAGCDCDVIIRPSVILIVTKNILRVYSMEYREQYAINLDARLRTELVAVIREHIQFRESVDGLFTRVML